ncbi:antibiotic biosynthesis monooxygenase [Kiloniella majae]|uniref:antibiotic biosynthesis monooxygenase n=1 Tax=Kiloniella majae TaxID=1938558 RepID=UPI000A278596|nr:antibiotic biosynthesis monooxygenase [Kiloniella majae]
MSNPVVLAVTDYVPLSKQDRYEALVDELHQFFEAEDGFLSVDTVRYNRPHQIEYTVLSRWADEKAAQQWRKNKLIQKKLSQIEAITGGAADIVEASGIGLWFDHIEGAEAGLPPGLPPIWKRIVLSVIGVYPMLILLLELTAPIIGSLPQLLQVFIIVVVLSTLLTWPIMPWLSRLLQPWLMAK